MVCKNSPNTYFEFFLFVELISLALSVKQFARPRRCFVLMLLLKWVTRVRQRQGQRGRSRRGSGGGAIVEAAARLPGGDVTHSVADVAVTHGHSWLGAGLPTPTRSHTHRCTPHGTLLSLSVCPCTDLECRIEGSGMLGRRCFSYWRHSDAQSNSTWLSIEIIPPAESV